MNTTHIKTISGAVLTLALSLGAMPQAFAKTDIYPGSLCTYERQGTGDSLDKDSGSTRSQVHGGSVVTCPIPHSIPEGFQGTQKAVTVLVRYRQVRRHDAIECMVRWTSFNHGSVNNTDSEKKRSSGFSNEIRWEQLMIPIESWAVLRCYIPEGVGIGNYVVASAD